MILAEDLLLLLTDDRSGKAVVGADRLELALAGAVLMELAALRRVDVSGPGESVKPGRLVVRDATPTGDDVLDGALRGLASGPPRTPQDALPHLRKGLRPVLLARLVDRGVLRAEEGRILGIFPTRSWPAVDSAHEEQVRAGLRQVLVDGRAPTAREAALVSLLQVADQVPRVLGEVGVPARELRRRAKAVAERGFAEDAVRRAIQAINDAAMIAVLTTTTIAATSAATS